MKKVAKLLMVAPYEKYLLLYRNDHPIFGSDPDLPGGTLEDGDLPLEMMIREVKEEIGVTIDNAGIQKVYEGTKYSERGTHYSLYITKLNKRPGVILSWEHSAYEWLDRETFLERSKNSDDTYMHMVYDTINNVGP